MKAITKFALTLSILFVLVGTSFANIEMNRMSAKNFLNKTSFIIEEAYDLVYGYNYYTSDNLSKAINHQKYAKYLFTVGYIDRSIYYSHIAREYALKVIYYCDNYWNNYYRPYYYDYYYNNNYYGSNNRGSWYYNSHNNYYYGNNSYYGNNYYRNNNRRNSGNNNGNYNSSNNRNRKIENTNSNNTTRSSTPNNQYSKFTTTVNNNTESLSITNFDNWAKSYYNTEELNILKEAPAITNIEMEREINNSTISKVTNDRKLVKADLNDFSTDVADYKTNNEKESRAISILRPADFGTTETVTRSTAGKEIAPIDNTNRRINTNSSTTNSNATRMNTNSNNTNATRINTNSNNASTTRTNANSSNTNATRTNTNSNNASTTRTNTNNNNTNVTRTNTNSNNSNTNTNQENTSNTATKNNNTSTTRKR